MFQFNYDSVSTSEKYTIKSSLFGKHITFTLSKGTNVHNFIYCSTEVLTSHRFINSLISLVNEYLFVLVIHSSEVDGRHVGCLRHNIFCLPSRGKVP